MRFGHLDVQFSHDPVVLHSTAFLNMSQEGNMIQIDVFKEIDVKLPLLADTCGIVIEG